jgi:hypothetical protein
MSVPFTQAFFFGAYASLLNAPIEAKNSLFETEQILLLWLMPTAALLAGLFTYVGIVSSLKPIVHSRQLYEDHSKAKALGDPSSKLYPDIPDLPHLRKLAFTPASMPMIFSITWLVVLGRLLIAWLCRGGPATLQTELRRSLWSRIPND